MVVMLWMVGVMSVHGGILTWLCVKKTAVREQGGFFVCGVTGFVY